MDTNPHTTPRLDLPFILSGQASKHITHNEALAGLDALCHLTFVATGVTSPPPEAAPGSAYTVADGAEGAFAAHAGEIAVMSPGGWRFHPLSRGMVAMFPDRSVKSFDGVEWRELGGSPDVAAQLGINTQADAVNRLAVKSEAVLMSADDTAANPSGDIRLHINRSGGADTAAFAFQTDYQTNVELGLVGDGEFRIKTSEDGETFATRLHVSPATGFVGVGSGAPLNELDVNADKPATLTRASVTNPAEAAGSGSALVLNAGGNQQAILLQYAGGGTYFYSSSSVVFYQATGAQSAHRFYSGSSETLSLYTDRTECKTPFRFMNTTVAGLPAASAMGAGATVFVTDDPQGAQPACSDGASWRRLTDRSVVA